jgi:hypothetical protein
VSGLGVEGLLLRILHVDGEACLVVSAPRGVVTVGGRDLPYSEWAATVGRAVGEALGLYVAVAPDSMRLAVVDVGPGLIPA